MTLAALLDRYQTAIPITTDDQYTRCLALAAGLDDMALLNEVTEAICDYEEVRGWD